MGAIGTHGTFSVSYELDHLSLNRTSDRLSPRTPAAIVSSTVAESSSVGHGRDRAPTPTISSFSNCGD